MHSAIASRQTAVTSARPAPSVARMLGNETSKGLILLWDNRRTILPELGVLLVFYFLIQFLVGGGRVVPALFAPTLLAFGFYTMLYIVTLKMVAGTLQEMNAGTLEQIHLSPLPSWALSLGRVASAATEAVAVMAVLGGVLVPLLGIRFSYQLAVVVPLLLTLVGVAGFSAFCWGRSRFGSPPSAPFSTSSRASSCSSTAALSRSISIPAGCGWWRI